MLYLKVTNFNLNDMPTIEEINRVRDGEPQFIMQIVGGDSATVYVRTKLEFADTPQWRVIMDALAVEITARFGNFRGIRTYIFGRNNNMQMGAMLFGGSIDNEVLLDE